MTVAHVQTVAFIGIEALGIDVQVAINRGLPSFAIVGLPDKAVGESRERVRAAISAMGLRMPSNKITVNLSPASLVKQGSHYDLPIILGLLVGMSVIPLEEVANYIVLGELSLDGSILPVRAVLPAAIHAANLNMGLICPLANGPESLLSGNSMVLACSNVSDLVDHLNGNKLLDPVSAASKLAPSSGPFVDIKNIKGQALAKKALVIAAAGRHNLFMIGSPGVGKSMLAKCLEGLLPPMTALEILENSVISSVAGSLDEEVKVSRPFRSPHHSCSLAAMVGGGSNSVIPGEVTLAHNGILFLDELGEFNRGVLDALRQPMEEKVVRIARAKQHVTYPANFQLVAAMNPCKCGYLFEEGMACDNAPQCGFDYQHKKVSGPLLDRFDIYLEVTGRGLEQHYQVVKDEAEGLDGEFHTEGLRKTIATITKIQRQRYQGLSGVKYNSEVEGESLQQVCGLDSKGEHLMKQAITKYRLSMRGYIRVLRVARTIADLSGSVNVGAQHLASALYYHPPNLPSRIKRQAL